jgi:hypothetical protein
MSSYIVVAKHPKHGEMHVLRNGNMSQTGTPRKFMSKELAREVAAEWAQHYADCHQDQTTVVVRKVGG